jgi:ketosteroid isomerase-like protein
MSTKRVLGGTMRPLSAILAEDVVWHIPGGSSISGVYRGRADVMQYVRRRRGGTSRLGIKVDVAASRS